MKITDKQLITLSLSIALCGVSILFLTQLLLKHTPSTYTEFLATPQNTNVVMQGEVSSSKILGNTTRITLQTSCEIPLVLFEPTEEFTKKKVTVFGQKKYYKGEPEIIVQDIHATLS